MIIWIQLGLEYQTFEFRIHLNSERFEILISNGSVFEPPFQNRNIQNGRYSLGRFIYKIFLLYIVKRPRLKWSFWMLWFRMVGTIWKPNTIQNGRFSLGCFTLYNKNILYIKWPRLTIVRLGLEPNDYGPSEYQTRSVFEPPLYPTSCLVFIWYCNTEC